jgi:nicotinamidase-related amidase
MKQALLVVDVQENMVVGKYSVPGAPAFLALFEERIELARNSGDSVIWVQNDGPEGDIDEPFSDGWQLHFTPAPEELVVRKQTQDVFESNPDLATQLRDAGVETVELIGMQSEYCVQASARGAKAAGFNVLLNPQLHATFHDGTPATNFSETYENSATDLAKRVHDSLIADGTLS